MFELSRTFWRKLTAKGLTNDRVPFGLPCLRSSCSSKTLLLAVASWMHVSERQYNIHVSKRSFLSTQANIYDMESFVCGRKTHYASRCRSMLRDAVIYLSQQSSNWRTLLQSGVVNDGELLVSSVGAMLSDSFVPLPDEFTAKCVTPTQNVVALVLDFTQLHVTRRLCMFLSLELTTADPVTSWYVTSKD